MGQVLARIADDPQPVRCRVEIDTEGISRERNRQRVHESRLGCLGVDGVDAAEISDAVQLAILHAEVDADQRRVRAGETGDEIHGSRALGSARGKAHEAAVIGQSEGSEIVGDVILVMTRCAAERPAPSMTRKTAAEGAKQRDEHCG